MENPDLPTQQTAQSQVKDEPGLFETIGSFPVWLLKIVALLTPDFLIKKTPPQDKKPGN